LNHGNDGKPGGELHRVPRFELRPSNDGMRASGPTHQRSDHFPI
jgi:hypothetical protein